MVVQFGWKIRHSGSLFGITHHAKQWPWGRFFCPNLTPMKDSYNIFQESYIHEIFLYNKTSPSTGQNGQLS